MKTFLSALCVFALSVLFFPGNCPSFEIGTDFEGGIPPGFTTDGWGLRDVSTCQYGPQTATSGIMCVGVPDSCEEGYPNGDPEPDDNWEGFFITPQIALGDSFPELYLRYNYWADFEGVTDTFDGLIIEFINLTRGTTVQVDSTAELQLTPTYDDIIGITNDPLAGKWAYCYDTLSGVLNSLGYPYVSFSYIDPWDDRTDIKRPIHSHSPQQFQWRAVQTVDLIAAGYADQGDTIQIQWHFASDQLENGQGYFLDDMYISNTVPVDNIPPMINVASPANFADVPSESISVPVKAVIMDVASGVLQDSVFLVYTLDEDTLETRVQMTSTVADTFVADVEPLPYDTDVYYRVVAYDSLLNRGSSPRFTFEVTDAVTLFYDDDPPAFVNPNPEIGSGFANKFLVPADTLYTLHKVLFYFARENGVFDVVVNSGPSIPGPEIARYDSITNGEAASTYFQYEFPEVIEVQGPSQFWVGMRHVSEDTLLDPQPLIDAVKDYSGVCMAFFGGSWQEEQSGETMIRVKVKRSRVSGIEGDDAAGGTLPKVYALSQNFPNPFNPRTLIKYDVPKKAGSDVLVKIDVYNIHGQLVKTLVNDVKEPGSYSVQWDGRNDRGLLVSSGIYFYRIRSGEFTSTRKMVLLK
ncbi:MAG: T9SS type A sorting domain-containing protein [Candidatus Glassbacteria bacterium]